MWGPFRAIGRAFKAVGVFVGKGFAALFGRAEAEAFAQAALVLLHSQLGIIAWIAVNEVKGLAISGLSKRQEAFRRIVVAAATAGITVKDSVINMLIELAVQKLKGEFGEQ